MSFFPNAMKPIASTLLSNTYDPAPGGMNRALPANEIADTEGQYLQDILVDYPGLARRRGPITPVPGLATLPRAGTALAMTLDPSGADRYGVFTGDAANGYFTVYSADRSAVTDLTWPFPFPTSPSAGSAQAYRVVDAKAALQIGAMLGSSSAYDSNDPDQAVAFWAGGTKPNYTTGTLTFTRGSVTVTGAGTSWNANVVPGMWLFANTDDPYTNALIGVVLTVNSDTSITLKDPAPYAATAKAYTLQTLRGLAPKVSVGSITCDVTSKSVNGGDTKFQAQGLKTGSWDIYRQSDMVWVGTVDGTATVTDTSLQLKANAAIAMADDNYVALRADSDYNIENTGSTQKVGFLSSVYAQRQWFANNGAQYEKTYRLWYSDTFDPEALDLTQDGNWIPINSTGDIQEPILGLGAAYNALVITKQTETFGVFGTDPTTFEVRKLEDDGTLSGGSVQQFGGGVIWAGREGIHYFDGINVNNLTQLKLGDVWKNSVRSFDPTTYRMYSFMERDHYILHIEKMSPTIAVVKNTVSETPDHWVVVINMDSGAVTLFQGLRHRGGITLPASSGHEAWYLVNGQELGARVDTAYVCEASALFDLEGLDSIYADYAAHAPTITNLVPNGSATVDTTKWSTAGNATGSSLTRDTSRKPFVSDTASFRLVSNTGYTMYVNPEIGVAISPGTIVAGQQYTLSFWHKADAVGTVWGADPGIYDASFANWTPPINNVVYIDGVRARDDAFKTNGGIWDPATTVAGVPTFGVLNIDATDTNWHYWTWTFTIPAGQSGLSPEFYGMAGGLQTFNVAKIQAESGEIAHGYVDTTGAAVTGPAVGIGSLINGPDFYFESKKFDGGNPTRLKRFKYLILHYLAQGGAIKVDTVLGLNNIGEQLSGDFPPSVLTWNGLRLTTQTWADVPGAFPTWNDLVQGLFQPARERFLKKSQHMSIRLYQENNTMPRLKIGPFEIGYKEMRPGRV